MSQGFGPLIPAFHAQVASDVIRQNFNALFSCNSGLTPPGSAVDGTFFLNLGNWTVYQYLDGAWQPIYRYNPVTGLIELLGNLVVVGPSGEGIQYMFPEATVAVNTQTFVIPNIIPAGAFIHSIQVKVVAIDANATSFDVGDQQNYQKYMADVPATLSNKQGMMQKCTPFATMDSQDIIVTCNAIPFSVLTLKFALVVEAEVLLS